MKMCKLILWIEEDWIDDFQQILFDQGINCSATDTGEREEIEED